MSIPVTRVSDVVKGGKLYKAKSDKLTSPLAPMFITVVTAMCVSCLENVPSNMSLSHPGPKTSVRFLPGETSLLHPLKFRSVENHPRLSFLVSKVKSLSF